MKNLRVPLLGAVLCSLFFTSHFIWAQTTVNINSSINEMVVKYKINSSTYYSSSGQYNIGRQDDTAPGMDVTSEDAYRSEFCFNLSSIPQNATITSATLTSQFLGNSNIYTFAIKQTTGSHSGQQLWDEISNASSLFSDLSYNSTHSNSSSGLISTIQSCLANGYLFFSVKSNYESELNTGASGGMSLSVTFIHPVSVTVINKMGVYTGGSVGVGINQSPQI